MIVLCKDRDSVYRLCCSFLLSFSFMNKLFLYKKKINYVKDCQPLQKDLNERSRT